MLDCSSLPVKEATTAWQESVGVMFDTRLRNAPDSGFRAHVEGFQFGDLLLGSCHSVAQTFDRSPRRIKRDNLDHLLLQFYTEGTCGRRDGGLDARTQPGDLWISDLAQPQATAASDFTNLNLIVPRRLLAPLLRAPDEHNLRMVPGGSPLVRLLHTHLAALFQSAPQLRPQDAAVGAVGLDSKKLSLNSSSRERPRSTAPSENEYASEIGTRAGGLRGEYFDTNIYPYIITLFVCVRGLPADRSITDDSASDSNLLRRY